MSKRATTDFAINFTDPEGFAKTLHVPEAACLYEAQSHGEIDVPDTTAGATSYAIPFGSIGTAATLLVIENKTGQSVRVKTNASTDGATDIPAGGFFAIGGPAAPTANPVTAAAVVLAGTQSGKGSIAYHVFGDPV